ncbi:MAG TPA: cyclic nucleotide-binding domain-containing protein [Burkholderiaceae bacterium]
MNLPLPTNPKPDFRGLIEAIEHAPADDSLSNPFSQVQWDVLTGYLLPQVLPQSQILFAQGTMDRALYLVESGTLSVHSQDAKGRLRMAIVTAGSVVGEAAFFSHQPRVATAQAAADCKLWNLAPLRYTELANRQPAIALRLAMAVGAVLAKRLADRRRRPAVT